MKLLLRKGGRYLGITSDSASTSVCGLGSRIGIGCLVFSSSHYSAESRMLLRLASGEEEEGKGGRPSKVLLTQLLPVFISGSLLQAR